MAVAIGIDIGTSYTKAVARRENGAVVAVARTTSPPCGPGLLDATAWWVRLREVLRDVLTLQENVPVAAICVSAIAPTLVVFDAARRDAAFGILYSSIVEETNGRSFAQCDCGLTDSRLAVLKTAAMKERLSKPCITDLVGYVNWRMTERLTINSVSLAEAGMEGGALDCPCFAVRDGMRPDLVAPAGQMGEITSEAAAELGVASGVPVCGGGPDTLGSVVGAGLVRASERMLYLGTFGSLLELGRDVEDLLDSREGMKPPFRWLLSVPDLGPTIESMSTRWFGSHGAENSLHVLDRTAEEAPAGAGGTLFLLPRWKNGMKAVGTFRFVGNRRGVVGDVRMQARALLESYGYAVQALEEESRAPIRASGGGSRSRRWLDILSGVFGHEVWVQEKAWEAAGAADIAARLAWRGFAEGRPYYISQMHENQGSAEVADNCRRAKELYRGTGWL